MLWSFAKLGHFPGKVLLQRMEGHLLQRLDYLNPQVRACMWQEGRGCRGACDPLFLRSGVVDG